MWYVILKINLPDSYLLCQNLLEISRQIFHLAQRHHYVDTIRKILYYME